MAGDAGEEQYAAGEMDHQVPHAGAIRRGRACAPQNQRRTDRHHLPEDEDGDQVPGQSHPDSRACVQHRGRQLETTPLPSANRPPPNAMIEKIVANSRPSRLPSIGVSV